MWVAKYVSHELLGYVVRRAHHLCICESRVTNCVGREVCMPRTIGLCSTASPSSAYLSHKLHMWSKNHELCESRTQSFTNYSIQLWIQALNVYVSQESQTMWVMDSVFHELLNTGLYTGSKRYGEKVNCICEPRTMWVMNYVYHQQYLWVTTHKLNWLATYTVNHIYI